jgi:predicted GNAT family N-acyltransferase
MIEFREYRHRSADYEAALELRMSILRGPLGLTFDPTDLEKEASEIHLGAFDGEHLVATLTLTPHGNRVKMRQVAVSSEHQGEGIGSQLVTFSESHARALGFEEMILHARETAVPFYLRLGYEVVGEPFIEVTIPHRAMQRRL